MALHQDLVRGIQEAPEGPRVAALFDVDGTLIAGYSALLFLKERLLRRQISFEEFREMAGAMTQFALGNGGFSGMMVTAARYMKDFPEDQYAAFGEEMYATQIARRVYPEARALVRAHQARGHTVAILSSATPYQVEPLARDLGIHHVICSRYEVANGLFTGDVVRPLCFGEGKLRAAEELAGKSGFDLDQSYFYSDSSDDVELMHRVGNPCPLNPDGKLTRTAEREQWPIRRFNSRGRSGPGDYLKSAAAMLSIVPAGLAGLPIWALTGSRREGLNFATSLFADVSSALIGLKLVVRGEEHMWSQRPAVFVFNHQSKADVIIIARLMRRDIASVAKQEIKKNLLLGKTMELAGTVFVDRKDAKSAIRSMEPLIDVMRKQGKSVVMAPEGTRTLSPRLAPFKSGAFHLAMQAGVPMVPIVIHNSGDVAPKGEFVMRGATVEVDVLPPIDTSEWGVRTLRKHMRDVRQLFLQTLGQDEEVESAAPAVVRTTQASRPGPETAAVPAATESTPPSTNVTKPRPGATLKKKARRKKKATKKVVSRAQAVSRKPRKAPRAKPLKKKALPGRAGKDDSSG